MGSQGGFYQSKEFLDLVKSIGEARSKAEEDRIVLSEIETLKRRISEPDIPKRKMKEYILRLVYIEMLGHDASFGYIHAVKMTHDDSLLVKRTGYLAVTLFLNEDHDLIILIVNTIQKDLKSDNYLVVCAALNAVCKLINEETIPAVLPQVVELLGHPKEAVRKKAIMALHRFYQKSPSSVSHLISNFRKRLCDNDPGVMGATLCPLFDLIAQDVNSYKDLVISFVSILKQVAERRLSKAYDYHQMPAPFIQIKLLKILALLGSGDKQASETMYTVVGDIFKKCDSSSNIGNAVLYECICCVSSIYPNTKLLDSAADAISRFLKSDSHNLKYMGIDALGRLIKISPEIAEQHQLAVIDCLEDPDDTLKRKTFELLYKMTKSTNVEVIVDRMIGYMISINDNHYKTEIASRCVELAEQFAPSNQWFIQTMNKVFEHAGDLVNIKIAHNLMRLIAEGFGEDDDNADSKLRSSAVESYLHILGEPKLPSVFLQVICWVLGEYGTADGMFSASDVTGKLCDVAEAYSSNETVKAYAVTALMKIYAFEIAAGRKVDMLPECQSLMEELLASHSTDLQQRAYELQAVIGLDVHAVECIMPLDASCEDIELMLNIANRSFMKLHYNGVDSSKIIGCLENFENGLFCDKTALWVDKGLSFLDGYIQEAIEKGAQPYIPESERSGLINMGNFRNQNHHESLHGLRFEAYELPKPAESAEPEPMYPRETYQTPVSPIPSNPSDAGSAELKLRLDGVQQKWGRPTYTPETSTSNSTSQKSVNGASAVNSTREAYASRKPQVEISHEKQKLAASLFGGTSKPEKRPATGHKVSKASSHMVEKSHVPNSSMEVAPEKAAPAQPPPDLLDLGEPTATSTAPSLDPFKQLEGLLDTTQDALAANSATTASRSPDVMALLYADTPIGIHNKDDADLLSGLSNPSVTNMAGATARPRLSQSSSKGSNPKDSLEKDALVRQMGVNPSSQNPNMFKDLLG
ncbi:hypothetical protein V6N13_036132 [Hibiscus sabdariffa]|uniref:Uncharacterized protein n=2 Tax=Hibiscus sabdariffa TaxID=183260 RepID=A0ABR2S7B7_9ROSI